ncbi:MazG-like family protein [Streptomyces sp. NPDC026672]|uniref:MazG-like family protein n=1 Tax=unclassified Streptomyces TaxID=2593676 RepID=UPI003401CFF3
MTHENTEGTAHSAHGTAAHGTAGDGEAGGTGVPDLWGSIDELWTWLDANRRHGDPEAVLLRILKLQEEVGEVAQAVIGATGQNPRKGVTHGWDDVRAELCDVAITALVALRSLTPDAREVFTGRLARVRTRSLGDPAGSVPQRRDM